MHLALQIAMASSKSERLSSTLQRLRDWQRPHHTRAYHNEGMTLCVLTAARSRSLLCALIFRLQKKRPRGRCATIPLIHFLLGVLCRRVLLTDVGTSKIHSRRDRSLQRGEIRSHQLQTPGCTEAVPILYDSRHGKTLRYSSRGDASYILLVLAEERSVSWRRFSLRSQEISRSPTCTRRDLVDSLRSPEISQGGVRRRTRRDTTS